MATNPQGPAHRRPPNFDETYIPGDPIPVAEASERNTDTVWALWSDLVAGETAFPDTVAMTGRDSAPMPLPASAATRPRVPPGSHASSTLEAVMLEARRNNRVCPQLAKWQQLCQMLTAKSQHIPDVEPALSLLVPAWMETSPLTKRMHFREHVEWAGAHGCIEDVYAFLKRLPEQHWLHMGE
jgi:hypothetical protein